MKEQNIGIWLYAIENAVLSNLRMVFKHSRPKIVPFLSDYKYIYIFKLSLLNEIGQEFEVLYPAPGDLRLDDKKSVYTH